MKRTVLIGAFTCFLFLCFGFAAYANTLGDVNADGVVNAADARLALRAAVGLEQFSDSQLRAADADHNKMLSAADARLILRYVVGLETFVHHFGQEDGSVETLVIADCGNDGLIYLFCSCGMYQKQTVPATGEHQFLSAANIENPVTCTQDGTAYYLCAVCGKRAYFPIPAAGHSLETQSVSPTCTKDGLLVRRCTVCDYTEQDILPATGHVFAENYTVDNSPTCIAAGIKSRHCVYCSARTDVVVLPMVAHQFGPWKSSEDGQTKTRTCLNCNKTQTERIIPDPETTTEEEVTTQDPTAPDESHSEEGFSSAEETTHTHDFNLTDSIAPSCTDPGRSTYRCSVCGTTKSETIPATGHKRAFTYSEDRKIRYTVCSVCSETISVEYTAGYCLSASGTETPFFDFEEMLQTAAAGTKVVLTSDYTLKRNAEIPAGVTLWIVCNNKELRANGSIAISLFESAAGLITSSYCKLYVPKDLTLSVHGTLIIDAEICPKTEDDGTSFDVFGNYGEIILDGQIVVYNGGCLYCHGFVNASNAADGRISVESGGKLYETFSVKNWKGMTAAYNLALHGNWPITDSAMDKLHTIVELRSGACFYGCGKLFYTKSNGSQVCSDFLLTVLDGEKGLVHLSAGASVKKTVSLDIQNHAITEYAFSGGAVFSGIPFNLTPETQLMTSDFAFPIGKNTAVVLHDGEYVMKASVLLPYASALLKSEDAVLSFENGSTVSYLF